jgi:hypothetical protein
MATFDFLRDELEKRPPSHGVTLADLLDMPEPLGTALSHLLHNRVMNQEQLSQELGLDMAESVAIGKMMVDKGYLVVTERTDGTLEYQPLPARVRGHSIPFDL